MWNARTRRVLASLPRACEVESHLRCWKKTIPSITTFGPHQRRQEVYIITYRYDAEEGLVGCNKTKTCHPHVSSLCHECSALVTVSCTGQVATILRTCTGTQIIRRRLDRLPCYLTPAAEEC